MPGADDWILGATAAQGAYQPVDAPWLPDVGGPAIGGGGQFSAGVPAVNRMADSISKALFVRPPEDNSPSPVIHQLSDPRFALTERDLDTATSLAMGFSGGGLTTKPIKAYHSSPHDFDKFDLKKIGTGEGAQVYGHGLYFAENPAVSGQGGQYWESFLNHPSLTPGQQHAGSRLRAEGFDKEKAIAATQRDVNDWMNPEAFPGRDLKNDPYAQKMLALRQAELEALQSGKAGPRTYEVNINADPAHMLDWENKLPMDSPARAKLYELGEKGMKYHEGGIDRQFAKDSILSAQNELLTGEGALRMIGKAVDQARPIMKAEGDPYALFGSLPAMSSRMLNEAGIPGIKYLDEGSRFVPDKIKSLQNHLTKSDWQPAMRSQLERELAVLEARPLSSNYVVFDPGIIDIMKKYGIAGAAPAGMGALAAQDYYRSSVP